MQTPVSFWRSCLALAAGLTLAVSAWAAPKVVKKVPPDFPVEAAQKGINSGTVTAKLTIEPDGKVSNVEIVAAEPKRVFDRATKSALSEWKFEASGEKSTQEIKLVYKNED